MTKEDVDKIVKELRKKTQSIDFPEQEKEKKIDKKTAWKLAKKVGRSLDDDSLPAPHPSRA